MIPSVWVELDQIPLTTSSKVNRQALITRELERVEEADSYSPPNTPVEELLVGIWQELLGVSCVGIDDNFFELGGHSLLATQLMSRVREVCGVEIGLRRLFYVPTVRGLA
jgi:acyl carrier protein